MKRYHYQANGTPAISRRLITNVRIDEVDGHESKAPGLYVQVTVLNEHYDPVYTKQYLPADLSMQMVDAVEQLKAVALSDLGASLTEEEET